MSTENVDTYFFRGLGVDQIRRIAARVPNTAELRETVLGYNPTLIAMRFPPGSKWESLPNVAVCLEDASLTLEEATYALEQAYVSLEYWTATKEHSYVGVSQAQYYAADAAHRVYATGEHLAAAIMELLRIPVSALERKRQTSRQAKLLSYLRKNSAEHGITKALNRLRDSEPFLRTLKYRGDWVHEQPPRVKGLGITYERRPRRWKKSMTANGNVVHTLRIGGGDPTDRSIDSVLDDATEAIKSIADATRSVVEHYDDCLARTAPGRRRAP